jgi:cytolysin (calcineurin-like family phosphatase)
VSVGRLGVGESGDLATPTRCCFLQTEVLIADAQKVKGLAPLACKTDKVDARVLAELSFRDLVPAIWLPTRGLRNSLTKAHKP